ncbi:MAG: putative Ig domain-containing protein [Methanomassiliicoccales archaeon]
MKKIAVAVIVIVLAVVVVVAGFGLDNDSDPETQSPVIADIPDKNVLVASTVIIPVMATNPNKMALQYTMEDAPSGATMTKEGVIYWIPRTAGEFTFDVMVNDTMVPKVSKTVNVVVTNDPVAAAPIIEPVALGLLRSNVTVVYNLKAYDANGDALTFSLSPALENASIDSSGAFTWTPEDDGVYTFEVKASDGVHTTSKEVVATVVDAYDVITRWNMELSTYLNMKMINNQYGSRAMAMMHVAMFDSINSIDEDYEPYHVQVNATENASKVAAAAAAAHSVLTTLYPADAATFDAVYNAQMAMIPDSDSKSDGIAIGQEVADAIVLLRSDDNSANANTAFTDGTLPGQYRKTSMMAPLMPGWGNVTPWAMTSGDQFRLAGPPELTSAEYAAAFNQTKALGARNSLTRTASQSEDALFWIAGVPDHWHGVAREMSAREDLDLKERARLFALLSVALADASISGWDNKYTYKFWRPVTAIQNADQDGNPATMAMANWMPFITTPAFPEYASGHSTTCMAGASLLASYFGSDAAVYVRTSATMGLPAHEYSSFSEMAQEAGDSRIGAGVHFSFSNEEALAAGGQIGEHVYASLMQPIS